MKRSWVVRGEGMSSSTNDGIAEVVVPLSADIVRTDSDGKGSFQFSIRISSSSDDSANYTVKRRYKQFDALHSSLKSNFNGLPDLPGKSYGFSNAKDEAEKRRKPLTDYVRSLLADPMLAKSDELANFLELSTALDLMAKLHKKDVMHLALVTAKDEELEQAVRKLSQASADRSAARAEAASLREAFEEGESSLRQQCKRVKTLEERLGEEEDKAEKAAALLADASAAAAAKREAASLKATFESLQAKAAAEAEAASAHAAELAEQVAAQQAQAVATDAAAREAREALVALRAEAEAAVAEAEQQAAMAEDKAEQAEEKAAACRDKLAASEARAASEATMAAAAATDAASDAAAATERAAAAEKEAANLRSVLDHTEASAREAGTRLASVPGIESKHEAAIAELATARSTVVELRDALATAQAASQAAQAEAGTLRQALQQAAAAAGERIDGAAWAMRLANADAKIKELGTALEAERAAAIEELAAAARTDSGGGGANGVGNGDGGVGDSGIGSGGVSGGGGGGSGGGNGSVSALPSPAQALSSFTVSVPSVREGRPSDAFKWAYHISVSCGAVSYTVLKRYSDFKSTHKKLSASFGGMPQLPPTYRFSSQDARFAEKRRAELAEYLVAVVRQPELRGCPEVQSFLELGLLLRRSVP